MVLLTIAEFGVRSILAHRTHQPNGAGNGNGLVFAYAALNGLVFPFTFLVFDAITMIFCLCRGGSCTLV